MLQSAEGRWYVTTVYSITMLLTAVMLLSEVLMLFVSLLTAAWQIQYYSSSVSVPCHAAVVAMQQSFPMLCTLQCCCSCNASSNDCCCCCGWLSRFNLPINFRRSLAARNGDVGELIVRSTNRRAVWFFYVLSAERFKFWRSSQSQPNTAELRAAETKTRNASKSGRQPITAKTSVC